MFRVFLGPPSTVPEIFKLEFWNLEYTFVGVPGAHISNFVKFERKLFDTRPPQFWNIAPPSHKTLKNELQCFKIEGGLYQRVYVWILQNLKYELQGPLKKLYSNFHKSSLNISGTVLGGPKHSLGGMILKVTWQPHFFSRETKFGYLIIFQYSAHYVKF